VGTNIYIQDSEIKLQQANQFLQQLEADLSIAERDYQNCQIATVARLRFLQRSPISQGWAVLLQSQNISDFGSSVLVMLNREIERRELLTGNRGKILIF
jgi:peptidoglycan hydrolase CwlO-like protein